MGMDRICGCGRGQATAPKRTICRLCINAEEMEKRRLRKDAHRDRPCLADGCDQLRLEQPSQVLPYCSAHRNEHQRKSDTQRRRLAGKPERITKKAPVNVPDGHKWCWGCDHVMAVEGFHRAPNGRQGKCKKCQYARYLERVSENPEAVRKIGRESQLRNRKRREYGLTNEQYDAMAEAQDGLCACCGQNPSPKEGIHGGLCVDHHHVTGWVRGLTCHSCNRGIGFLGDTTEAVERALRYLQRADAAYEGNLAAGEATLIE